MHWLGFLKLLFDVLTAATGGSLLCLFWLARPRNDGSRWGNRPIGKKKRFASRLTGRLLGSKAVAGHR